MFPELKKRLNSFFVGEEGRVSKQALMSVGAFLSTGVLASVLLSNDSSAHTNDLSLNYGNNIASATHTHHSSGPCTACGSACGSACGGGPCAAACACAGGPCACACACACACGACAGACGACGACGP